MLEGSLRSSYISFSRPIYAFAKGQLIKAIVLLIGQDNSVFLWLLLPLARPIRRTESGSPDKNSLRIKPVKSLKEHD
jgi:hypothetical protein